jgi:hypothetical protein
MKFYKKTLKPKNMQREVNITNIILNDKTGKKNCDQFYFEIVLFIE